MAKKIRVVGALIELEGKYLITQRLPTSSLPLLWEFPGGRVEEGETDQKALARELSEEMAIKVEVQERAMHVEHSYEKYDIDFNVYRCKLLSGEVVHKRIHDHRWVKLSELDDYPFPPADEKTLEKLLDLA